MITKTAKLCVLALGLGLLTSGPALAVPVTTTISGSVDFADPSNPFNLAVGDPVTAVAVYDDSVVPAAGSFDLEFDSAPSFSLTVTLGDFSFVEADVDDFGSGFPILEFFNGDPVGLFFAIDGFAFGAFDDLRLEEDGGGTAWFLDEVLPGPDNILLEGSWDIANAVTVPNDVTTDVPEPAAWLLFAGGLAALTGLRRRGPAARRAPG